MRLIRKELIILTTAGALLFNSILAFAGHSDYTGNWAEKQITDSIEKGFIKGYEDGTFKPDNEISRAEFFALVNRAFSLNSTKKADFNDIENGAWYIAEVEKALAAGYINGYEDGTIKPNSIITRLEASKILTNIIKLDTALNANVSVNFKDKDKVPEWGRSYIELAVKNRLLFPSSDGYVQPYKGLTRAEAIAAIYKAKGGQIDDKNIPTITAEREYTGVLFTACCKNKDPEKETKKCLSMPGCAANGYGIKVKLPDEKNKFYAFDENGHKLAKENILDKTQKNSNITIKVKGIEGEREDGKLTVSSIIEDLGNDKETVAGEVYLTGTLIDKHCFAFGDPESDTIECLRMNECAESGYGIAAKNQDGTYSFYILDSNGQDTAKNILKNTKKESNIIVLGKGIWDGNLFITKSLDEK